VLCCKIVWEENPKEATLKWNRVSKLASDSSIHSIFILWSMYCKFIFRWRQADLHASVWLCPWGRCSLRTQWMLYTNGSYRFLLEWDQMLLTRSGDERKSSCFSSCILTQTLMETDWIGQLRYLHFHRLALDASSTRHERRPHTLCL
jgi:hypothetical protein